MKTIIYHAITTYHMLEFIVHSVYNKNEQAILLLPQSLVNYYPGYQYLIDNNIMTKVIIMPDIVSGKDEADIVKRIDTFVKSNLVELIEDNVEIHLAGGQFMFSAYLINNNIPFVFYEEASGILSRNEKLQDNVKVGNPLMYEIATKNGMFDGSNDLVKYRVCNKEAQTKEFQFREDDEDFDIVNILQQLEEQERRIIINFFTDVVQYDVPQNSCLLLTQHFANLSILTYEQQVLLYQTFCDYFLEGYSIIFKPHPFDFINYNSIFEGSVVLRERFPSEFLPFMFKNRPEKVATISSTSIFSIKTIFNSSLEMDFDFEQDYRKMAKYYALDLIICQLIDKGFSVNLVGLNTAYFKMKYLSNSQVVLYDKMEDINELVSDKVYVFDKNLTDININALYLNNINCIFLDPEENKSFYRYAYRNLWEKMAVIQIQKTKLRDENIYINMLDENIYVVGGINKEIMIQESKKLTNTGITLNINKFDYEEYEKMALQGKLDATEKRLAYYVTKCEALETKIQNLKDKGFPIA